jgi:LacI family transcriptional regulator
MADIAKVAGVSTMTVSRVLRGDKDGAGEATRLRVLGAAKRFNYRLNAFAKGLKVDRSDTIGLVVPDIVNPFFPEIIRGAELVARDEGYILLTCNVVEDPKLEEETLWRLVGRRVDGIIICSARLDDRRLRAAIGAHRAAVLINRSVPSALAGSVEIDYRIGAERVIDHLVGRGRRRIAFLAGPPQSRGGRQRLAGITAALQRQGLSLVYQESCTPDLEGGARAAQSILQRRHEIDAAICYNDLMALGLIASLKSAGVQIPADLAVVGCDDIPTAALVSPALTTLSVDKQELGRVSMRLLLDRIRDGGSRRRVVVVPELIVRETT